MKFLTNILVFEVRNTFTIKSCGCAIKIKQQFINFSSMSCKIQQVNVLYFLSLGKKCNFGKCTCSLILLNIKGIGNRLGIEISANQVQEIQFIQTKELIRKKFIRPIRLVLGVSSSRKEIKSKNGVPWNLVILAVSYIL